MELSEEQAKARLESPDNLANKMSKFREGKKLSIDLESHTATVNSTNKQLPRLPEKIRKEIEERALSGTERQRDIAKDYGTTQSLVSQIKKEAEARDSAARSTAVEKMMLAMGLITEERLEGLRAIELSRIAANMAQTISAVTPKQDVQAAAVNLIVYAPEIRDESKFRVVEIGRNDT